MGILNKTSQIAAIVSRETINMFSINYNRSKVFKIFNKVSSSYTHIHIRSLEGAIVS